MLHMKLEWEWVRPGEKQTAETRGILVGRVTGGRTNSTRQPASFIIMKGWVAVCWPAGRTERRVAYLVWSCHITANSLCKIYLCCDVRNVGKKSALCQRWNPEALWCTSSWRGAGTLGSWGLLEGSLKSDCLLGRAAPSKGEIPRITCVHCEEKKRLLVDVALMGWIRVGVCEPVKG